jgi:hypothetical protein
VRRVTQKLLKGLANHNAKVYKGSSQSYKVLNPKSRLFQKVLAIMAALTEMEMKIREQFDKFMEKLEQGKFPENKDNHSTQEVENDKKEHVSKKTQSGLQVKNQTPLLQNATIQCTQKLQLEDQGNSQIKILEDKLAKH